MTDEKEPCGFEGLRILMAEDQMILAMSLEELLKMMGCHVVKVPSVSKALRAIQTECFDGALLDINLSDECVYPVAKELDRRGVPFILMTGYGDSAVHPDYRHRPILHKPFMPEELEETISSEFIGRAR